MKSFFRGVLVAAAIWTTACGSRTTPPPPIPATEHEHHAPHGGTLVGLGSEFAHVELVLDSAGGSLTAYVLDGDAEESVRIKQPFLSLAIRNTPTGAIEHLELAARADVLTGETVGDTSEFSVTSPSLGGRSALKGSIDDITVKGEEFRGVPF